MSFPYEHLGDEIKSLNNTSLEPLPLLEKTGKVKI